MTDTPATATATRPATSERQDASRTISPRRSLPGGRAVIGAFLVVVAAVGTFGAYLSATAAPDTSYLVAARSFEIGHVVEEADLVGAGAGFRAVPIDLPDEQAAGAIASDPATAEQLLGQVVVAPIGTGDLALQSQFVAAADAGDGVAMSFSLPVDRALAGRVGAGERVDVIATYARDGADGSETRLVARNVTVVTATSGGEGLNGGRFTLTVELPDLDTAQRLQHAVDTAQVAILRSGDADATTPAPTASDTPPTSDSTASGQENAPAGSNDSNGSDAADDVGSSPEADAQEQG